MNEIEIKIVQSQVIQGSLTSHLDVFRRVVRVPQLARHVKVGAAAKAGLESASNSVADLWTKDE
jgi:hypothetical protein